MKKIISLLLLAIMLFSYCSKDDNEREDIFIKSDPLRGQWSRIDKDRNDSIVVTYDNGNKLYQIFDPETKRLYGWHNDYYKLTSSEIVYFNNDREYYRTMYLIKGDSLSIKEGEIWIKYNRLVVSNNR